jgi:hypothetical protein
LWVGKCAKSHEALLNELAPPSPTPEDRATEDPGVLDAEAILLTHPLSVEGQHLASMFFFDSPSFPASQI